METFGERLHRAMAERGPLCVGIDPHPSLLTAWGLGDDIDGLTRFTRTVEEALADRVAVFKPQSAFFERFGSRGVSVLESTIRQLRDGGALVLLDVKLPKVDGLEVLRRIRSDPRTQSLPVVVLTTSSEETDIVNSYKLGANSFVRKPVIFDDFVHATKVLGVYWLLVNQAAPDWHTGG